jgi:hypothetical protein
MARPNIGSGNRSGARTPGFGKFRDLAIAGRGPRGHRSARAPGWPIRRGGLPAASHEFVSIHAPSGSRTSRAWCRDRWGRSLERGAPAGPATCRAGRACGRLALFVQRPWRLACPHYPEGALRIRSARSPTYAQREVRTCWSPSEWARSYREAPPAIKVSLDSRTSSVPPEPLVNTSTSPRGRLASLSRGASTDPCSLTTADRACARTDSVDDRLPYDAYVLFARPGLHCPSSTVSEPDCRTLP